MNILEALSIRLPCTACGQFYDVPLNDILISNQMLEQGCPLNDETECPPVFQTRLVGREVLGESGHGTTLRRTSTATMVSS